MSFKNSNLNTDMDVSLEWGDYENWEEYDNDDVVVNHQEVSDQDDEYDTDFENNRSYISGKFKSFSAPKPLTLRLSNKIAEVVDDKKEDDGKEFEEYKEVMKTRLTWLTKPTVIAYDSDDSDFEETKLVTISDDDDYPSLSSEMFKKNKVKKEKVLNNEEPSSSLPDEIGWKSANKKKKKNDEQPISSIEFTKPCSNWIEGTKCNRKGCTYAHTEKELKINYCNFKNCNAVIEKDGYFSNKNGDRFCCKIHRHESVDNFLERLGVKKNKTNIIPEELKYALSLLSSEKYIEFEGVKHFGQLSSNKEESKKKEKTQMCRSIKNKTNCPHKNNCRYAHNFNELVVSLCGFNEKCRGVSVNKGTYTNSVDGKVCCYRHPGETKDNYRKRVRV